MRYLIFMWIACSLAACHSNNSSTSTGTKTDSTAATAVPASTQKPTVENDSQHIDFYPNGYEKTNAQLKAGKMDGTFHSNYENGKTKEKGQMAADLRTGVWRIYDSLGHLTQVSLYAKDQVVKDLDTADYHLQNTKLPAEKMQINLPYDWQIVDVGTNPMVVMVCEKKCNDADKFCPNFTFTKEPLDGKGTFETYINYGNEMLKHTIPNFKLLSQGKVDINGYKAYRVEYRGKAQTMSLGSIMTLYYSKDTVYIMNCMAKDQPKGEFDRYQNLFMEISSSVKPL